MPPRKIFRLNMKGAPGVPYTSRSVSSQVVVSDHGPTAMPSPPKVPPGINTVSAWNGFQRVVNDSEPHDGGVVGRTVPRFLWVGRWVRRRSVGLLVADCFVEIFIKRHGQLNGA